MIQKYPSIDFHEGMVNPVSETFTVELDNKEAVSKWTTWLLPPQQQTKRRKRARRKTTIAINSLQMHSYQSWAQFWDAGIGSKNTAIRVPCSSRVCRPPCLVLHWCEQKESEVQLDKAKLMELQGLHKSFWELMEFVSIQDFFFLPSKTSCSCLPQDTVLPISRDDTEHYQCTRWLWTYQLASCTSLLSGLVNIRSGQNPALLSLNRKTISFC